MGITRRVALWLVAVTLAVGATGASPVAAERYTDTEGRYSVTVPDEFVSVYTARPFTAEFVLPNAMVETVRASVQVTASPRLDPSTNLEALVGSAREAHRQVGAEMVAEKTITLGGLPAQRFDYYAPVGANGARVYITQVAAISATSTYIITCIGDVAYFTDFDAFSRLLDSFAPPPGALAA